MEQVRTTFISAEKLGVLFSKIETSFRESTKKKRAANFRWIEETLQRLGLIPYEAQYAVEYITIGCDQSGNFGVVVVEGRVQIG